MRAAPPRAAAPHARPFRAVSRVPGGARRGDAACARRSARHRRACHAPHTRDDPLMIAARRPRGVDAAHLLRLKPGSLSRDAHAGAAVGRELPTLKAFRA